MTSKIIVNTIEADTGISSVTFASNINLQNDSSVLVSSSGIRLGTGSTIAAPSANEITLSTNSAERFRITSAGNLGIGDASPTKPLTVGTTTPVILLDDQSSRTLEIRGPSATHNATVLTTSVHDLLLGTNNTERVRITSGGELKIPAGIGPQITFENQHGHTGDAVISTFDDGVGTLLCLGSNFYFNSSGSETRYNTSEESAGIIINRTGTIDFNTGGTSATATSRLRIREAGGHRIQCNESWHAANLSECNTDRLALNVNQTRQGQTKGIALGCVGGGSGSTGIQAYDTSDNSANTLELNPFGGNLLYGDTASDLSNDHKFIAVGAKHAFQYDGNAGTYLSVILGSANGTVDLEADARSGAYPDLRFITTNDEQLRVLAAGHIWKKNDGALWHGTHDIDEFSNAGRSNYNKVSIRAGDPNDGTSPTNDNSAIKIYPAGNRGTTAGTLSGGIAWQHLDPSNGSWDSLYGAGSQMWMGAAIHDTPGQERGRFNLWMNSGTTGNSNPNQLAIEAYPNGMVRHPKNPAFMVRNSTNANAFSADARATWNITLLNNGSHFDMTNNIFTAPIDGIYTFSCMMLSNASTRLFHCFRVNNTIIEGTRSEGHAVANSYATLTITMTYSLSANDYVDVYVRNNNGYGGIYTNFNGFLVG